MIRPALAVGLLALLLSVLPPAGAAVAPADEQFARLADAEIARAYPGGAPGAAVLVKRSGAVVLRKGYGLAQLDYEVPIAPEQVFEIGSVTKQFTAAAILRLAEQGRLALTDPITRFLPDFPTGGRTVTLEHLLTHTSGVPNYTDLPEWIPRWREDMSLATLIGLFAGRPLDFEPGQSWSYSNSGYVLLGAVIEKVTGRSYEDYVESELFAPLGMTGTRYGHQEEVVAGRVAGYVKGPAGWLNAPYLSLTQPYSAGALMSTVDDLARWSDALEAGRVVSAAARDRMFTPAVLRGGEQDGVSTRYGLGNAVTSVAGRPAHEHGGGIHGFVADLLRVPEGDLLVIVLSNNPTVDAARRRPPRRRAGLGRARAAGAHRRARRRRARRLRRRLPGRREAGTSGGSSPAPARACACSAPAARSTRCGRSGQDLFEVGDADTTARFRRDAAGRVVAMEVDQGIGPVFRSPRTDEPLPVERAVIAVDPATFDAFAGVYTLAPGFELAITRERERPLRAADRTGSLRDLPRGGRPLLLQGRRRPDRFRARRGGRPGHRPGAPPGRRGPHRATQALSAAGVSRARRSRA